MLMPTCIIQLPCKHMSVSPQGSHVSRSVERYLRSAEPALPQLLAGLPSPLPGATSPDTVTKVCSSSSQSPSLAGDCWTLQQCAF